MRRTPRLASVPGVENGPPIDAPIALRVQGRDLDTLRALASRVERMLENTPGTQYVDNPVRCTAHRSSRVIDRAKAGLLGIPTLEIDRTLRLGLAGLEAGVLREGDGEARDVVVRLAGSRGQLPRPSTTSTSPRSGAHAAATDRRRSVRDGRARDPASRSRARVTVTSFVRTGYNTNRVTSAALARLDSLTLPKGYRIVPAGEIESRQESFGGIGSAMIVATFLILAVLILEFKTFRGTLIVASVIPLGVMGGILALFLTGNTLCSRQ